MSIGIRLHNVAGYGFEDRLTLAKGQGFQCIHLDLPRVLGEGYMAPRASSSKSTSRISGQSLRSHQSHNGDALKLFIDRLAPVVDAAQKFGAVLANEPVFAHIVCDAKRARMVFDTIHLPNLQIILEPVSLLDAQNLERRNSVIREVAELLIDVMAVARGKPFVHIIAVHTAGECRTGA